MKYIKNFDKICSRDINLVGGKNASLGEMIRNLKKEGIDVPSGFAITTDGYKRFIKYNNLEKKIFSLLDKIDKRKKNLQKIGSSIRELILKGTIPNDLKDEIESSFRDLLKREGKVTVAIRSSATAEDLEGASFAGQLESYLNISSKKELLKSFLRCLSSLFTDRAIAYRIEKGFSHKKVFISVGVQRMIRSDLASSGVMFTLDTESGFRDVITITGSFGLGENIVQGEVIPDEYQVFKPFLNERGPCPIIEKTLGEKEKKMVYCLKRRTKNIKTTKGERERFILSNREIVELASIGKKIEEHYKKPMDIEWAKDGRDKKLYIVQARPETVQSRLKGKMFKSYRLLSKKKESISGIAIGEAISAAPVQIIKSKREIGKFKKGSILVTANTTPDWVPIMKKAAGIITDHGGRTSHAAIVSRELGIPAVVGCKNATDVLKDRESVTIDCSSGDIGKIYRGILEYREISQDISKLKNPKISLMINIASPQAAFKWWQLPVSGIGLARIEFIITNMIRIHPLALLEFNKIKSSNTRKKIRELTCGYPSLKDYFIEMLSTSIAKIAASQYPKDVIVRLSDFKTNEYRELIGGEYFEKEEENPMIGFRGASRYYSKHYKKGFALECLAIKRARDMGFKNIIVMIPFCRTPKEADLVISLLSKNGLNRKKDRLKIYVMAEIPSNVFLAEEFAKRFDGFSIGSNDLTQLILGVSRDSEDLKDIFDARDASVKKAIKHLIKTAKKYKIKIGICGQAPSDHVDFAQFLKKEGIDSISLNPDSVIPTIKKLSK